MANIINVQNLPKEEVRFIQKMVELFREKAKKKNAKRKERIDFAGWNLGVKGKLTRREIYEYL